MAIDFDRIAFLDSMSTAVSGLQAAAALGTALARQGVRRIIFVGCGAPNREMSVIQYWVEHTANHLECRRYFPAEFTNQKPPILDASTLVILGSHSGTTPETVFAAQYARGFPCVTVGITQEADSPLGRAVQHVLAYNKSPDAGYQHGYYSLFMLALALVSAIMADVEAWTLHEKVITALGALPRVLVDTMDGSEARVTSDARLYHQDRFMYVVASGPMFCTAYVVGVCVLMEMQWMHVYPAEAAEWFHGPFEVVDETTPLLLLLGEDPSRPEMERVARFCKKYTQRIMTYDSREFEMKGIDGRVRAIFAPMVLQSVMDRLGEHLAIWHKHPLTTRRYMWKTEY